METIHKRSDQVVRANLKDYDAGRASLTWDAARALLAGFPGGGLNIAHEAIDRHVAAGLGDKVAIRWIAKDESRHDFTYADLKAKTNRFANALASIGVKRGDRGRFPRVDL